MLKVLGLSVFNVLLVILLSPLLEGVVRKTTALVQSRIGPPLIQPYYDILKLLGKENLTSSDNFLFKYTPIFCFSIVLIIALLTPFGISAPLGMAGDTIVFIYLLTLSAVMVMMSGISSGSPFGAVGSAREVMMVLTVEPVIAIALITAGVKAGSLSFSDMVEWQVNHGLSFSMVITGIALFLAILTQLCKLPFDIVEAETEIMGGPFIEQSGPRLALFKWSIYVKEMIFASIFLSIFLPWPYFHNAPLNIIVNLIKIVVFIIIVGVVHSVNPRIRIDQSIKYFGAIIFISFAGLAFALVGT